MSSFQITTNHKPLIYAFRQKSESIIEATLSTVFIGQFSTAIRRIAGSSNVVADTLSRLEEISLPDFINMTQLRNAQDHDEVIQALIAQPDGLSSLNLQALVYPGTNQRIWCNITDSRTRLYLPPKMIKVTFDMVHGLVHPSQRVTSSRLAQVFVWPSMRKDTAHWVKTCIPCRRSKVNKHSTS